jgi:hypothetical protein
VTWANWISSFISRSILFQIEIRQARNEIKRRNGASAQKPKLT